MGGEKYKFISYAGIVVFGLAIVYFIVAIFTTMSKGDTQSESVFSAFVEQANINSYSNLQTSDDYDAYYQSIKNVVDQNTYIGAVILSASEEPIFAYPLSSSLIQAGADNLPTLVTSSPMLKTHSMSVLGNNGQFIVLNATTYVLRPIDIYNAARISFLLILAYTLALLVIIVYSSLSGRTTSTTMRVAPSRDFSSLKEEKVAEREVIPIVFREQESSWDNFFVDVLNDDEVEQKNEVKTESKTESIIAPKIETKTESIIEPKIETKTESIITAHNTQSFEVDVQLKSNFIDDYINEETNGAPPVSVDDDSIPEAISVESTIVAETEDSTISEINDPMGLFSNITGVGWESYMETRLDSELIRAASSEQDLALVIVQIKGIENNIALKKRVATLLLDYFKYRDFVYEYKIDGFAGIMLDISLDQTMLLCEQLYSQLDKLIQSEGLINKVGIGLSTRALRILPGSRLITEASKAVVRAFEEDGLPIVAFRVSPEKYRQFVANSTI